MINLDSIINSCRFLLNNYPEAQNTLDYLNSRLNPISQEKFKFGYFPDPNNLPCLLSLVNEEDLFSNKLLFNKTITDSLYPRTIKIGYFDDYPLIMPIHDVYGNPIALLGRTILDEHTRQEKKISKYKYTINYDKSNNVFGLFENKKNILEKDTVYIVEGQIDVIKAMEFNYDNIVAIGGSSMSAYQFSLITRYTNNLILLLDNDDAGEKGRKMIADKFGSYCNIFNFYLPEQYKDIDEFFRMNPNSELELLDKR